MTGEAMGPTPFVRTVRRVLQGPAGPLPSFVGEDVNLDRATVDGFGEEWERFGHFSDDDVAAGGREYFADLLPDESLRGRRVLDIGCGSGRWTRYFAARAAFVDAADPSSAALVAQRATSGLPNVRVVHASVDSLPYAPESFDVVASVGVLHHVRDTASAVTRAASFVKPGGKLYLYLYYRLDDRPWMYRLAFAGSALLRGAISRLPSRPRIITCEVAAVVIYLPLVILARLVRRLAPARRLHERVPLHYYVDKPWKIIRNDALDRLGTPLERRFSRAEIEAMLRDAGLVRPAFGDTMPRWRVVAEKP